MSIIVIIIAIIIGLAEGAKDRHDYNKFKNSGGMEARYDCWEKK